MTGGYRVNSYWGPRAEAPQKIAARCEALFDRLNAISPELSRWTYVGRKTRLRAAATQAPTR